MKFQGCPHNTTEPIFEQVGGRTFLFLCRKCGAWKERDGGWTLDPEDPGSALGRGVFQTIGCVSCRFCFPARCEAQRIHECRRWPPKADKEHKTLSYFPRVFPGATWCGEYALESEPPKEE